MRGFMKNRVGKGRCHLLGEWGTVLVRPEGGTGLDFLGRCSFCGARAPGEVRMVGGSEI